MQTILITGAGGFLGRAVTERLIQDARYHVIATYTNRNVIDGKRPGGGTV